MFERDSAPLQYSESEWWIRMASIVSLAEEQRKQGSSRAKPQLMPDRVQRGTPQQRGMSIHLLLVDGLSQIFRMMQEPARAIYQGRNGLIGRRI